MRPVILLVAPLLLAAGGDMSVSAFNAKASGLRSKGAMAMFSRDFGLLKNEFGAAAKSYRAMVMADKKAGRPAHSCPPKNISLSAGDIMTRFAAIPVAQQRALTVRRAFADWMKERYPCR